MAYMDYPMSMGKMLLILTGLKTSAFFIKWLAFLDELAFVTHDIIIPGDFNFNLHNKCNYL